MGEPYPITERYGPYPPGSLTGKIVSSAIYGEVIVAKTVTGEAAILVDAQGNYHSSGARALVAQESYELFFVKISPHEIHFAVSYWLRQLFTIDIYATCQVYDPVRVVLDNLIDVKEKLIECIQATIRKFAPTGNAEYFEDELEYHLKDASISIPGIKVHIQKVLAGEYLALLLYEEKSERIAELQRLEAAEEVYKELSETASIWTSGDDGSEVADALKELLAEYDVVLEDDGPPVRGSWKQRFKLIWNAFTRLDAVHTYDWQGEVARRLEIELVERRAAEVDGIKATTVSKLLPALEKHEKVVIRLGQIIIVKCHDKVVVETIDPVTAAKLERRKELLADPEGMMRLLSGEVLADEPALQAQPLRELGDE